MPSSVKLHQSRGMVQVHIKMDAEYAEELKSLMWRMAQFYEQSKTPNHQLGHLCRFMEYAFHQALDGKKKAINECKTSPK